MDSNLYNEWRLVSLSPLPLWALGALLAAAVAAVALALLPLRREPLRARRWTLLALRVLAAAALVVLLLEPGRRLMQTTRVKNRVVVLFDRSASMAFPTRPGGPTRIEAARALAQASQERLREWAGRFTVELAGFDRDLQALDPARLGEQLVARGPGTDLASALRQAAAGGGAAAGRKLSGIVVISDGADNAELAAGMTPKVKAMLEDLEVPISTLALGAQGPKDLAVERVTVDDFAFVRNTVEVGATLRAHGFEAMDVPVVLKREGRVVATRTVRLEEGGAGTVTFSFAPDQTGHFVYTVEAPVFADEAVPGNNSRSFALKVIRDRVRVLLVVGRPSWDERFLRGLLKQDPNVDLISFFILRTTSDDPRVFSDEELSLIPFPVREIFQEQLKTFDLVVLQNFAYDERAYNMQQYLKGMRDYIHGGGAFVMVGGENSFGEGRYERTELAEALPVEPAGLPINLELFQARLTAEGARNPVMAVAPTGEGSAKAWSEMPALEGVQLTRAKQGARVLLEHPFLTEGGRNVPVVVLGEFGRGRVMAVTTDSTWSWSFGAAAQGGGQRVYDRFWNNAIRWLVRDPELTPVKVDAEKPAVEPGEPIAAVVSARQSDYGPAAGAQIELDLVQAEDGQLAARQTATAGPEGTARIELVAPKPGPYKLIARASRNGAPLGQGEDAVAVRAAGPELSDAAPRPQLLQAIAEATGGLFEEAADRIPEVPLIDPETVEVGRRKDLPLWDRWYSLAVLAAALAAEWVLRRRWGYP